MYKFTKASICNRFCDKVVEYFLLLCCTWCYSIKIESETNLAQTAFNFSIEKISRRFKNETK